MNKCLVFAGLFGGFAVTACSDEPVVSSGPPISVSAIHLTGDFNENILAAERKYKGRSLKVGGTIDFIDKSGDGAEVRFVIPGTDAGVRASFTSKHLDGVETLKSGSWTMLLCNRVEEGPITPVLLDCRVSSKRSS